MDYWNARWAKSPRGECRFDDFVADHLLGSHFVDLGCGPAHFWIGRRFDALRGVDRSVVAIRLAARDVPRGVFVVGDISKPELVPHSGLPVDTALCLNVLFHMKDRDAAQRAIRNLYAVDARRIIVSYWLSEMDRPNLAPHNSYFPLRFDDPRYRRAAHEDDGGAVCVVLDRVAA